MYYPCSENKGADHLRGYREADLRLCFRIGKNPVFSRCGSIYKPWLLTWLVIFQKVQVGNDQEKAQSERNSHSKNEGGGLN